MGVNAGEVEKTEHILAHGTPQPMAGTERD